MPIFLAFDQSGLGHYDAFELSLSKCIQPSKAIPKTDMASGNDDSCRSEQGAKKVQVLSRS